MTSTNRLLALALMQQQGPTKRLVAANLSELGEAEERIVLVISEETEREREIRRPTGGKVPQGLLGAEIDYVDTLPWDDLLQSPTVVRACTDRLGITPAELLAFAARRCRPGNWQALFWMRAWYEQVDRNASADVSEALKEFQELHARKQFEESRAKAKAMADARHGKPGGAREKQAAIRALWATGKYSSRTVCAEQECGALGMSYETARKALRNTPDPLKG